MAFSPIIFRGAASDFVEYIEAPANRTITRYLRKIDEFGNPGPSTSQSITVAAPGAPTLAVDVARQTPTAITLHITPAVAKHQISFTLAQVRLLTGSFPTSTDPGVNGNFRWDGCPDEIIIPVEPHEPIEIRVCHEDIFTPQMNDRVWATITPTLEPFQVLQVADKVTIGNSIAHAGGVEISGAATAATFTAVGSPADVHLRFTPKGNGRVSFGSTEGSYRYNFLGNPQGQVLVGFVPSSLAANDILMYFSTPPVTGSFEAFNVNGNATVNVSGLIQNSNNSSATAHAKFELKTVGESAGDPKFVYTISGVLNVANGLDNSDGNQWKLSASDNLGTNDLLVVDPATGTMLLARSGSLLRFNGVTNAFPALKRSGTRIQARLADDSGFGDLEARQLFLDATMTAAGTTGAQTINKAAGSVNFAAGATSVVVTNSLVTANSIIIATIQTNDATAEVKNVVPAAGSFTINLKAAATAETKVAFMVINQ